MIAALSKEVSTTNYNDDKTSCETFSSKKSFKSTMASAAAEGGGCRRKSAGGGHEGPLRSTLQKW